MIEEERKELEAIVDMIVATATRDDCPAPPHRIFAMFTCAAVNLLVKSGNADTARIVLRQLSTVVGGAANDSGGFQA
jgi:hypothetical protein